MDLAVSFKGQAQRWSKGRTGVRGRNYGDLQTDGQKLRGKERSEGESWCEEVRREAGGGTFRETCFITDKKKGKPRLMVSNHKWTDLHPLMTTCDYISCPFSICL